MSTVGRIDIGASMLQGETPLERGGGGEPRPGHEADRRARDGSMKEHAGHKGTDVPMLVKQEIRHWLVYMKHEVDPASGRTQVILIDPQTGEVIRKIPPDAEMHLAAALHSMIGKLLNRHI